MVDRTVGLARSTRPASPRIRKAVFPVAGLGTRFLPATRAMPKEMLPVVDKPLIEYAVEEARAAGIEEFIFVTGRGKGAIENHFDTGKDWQATLRGSGGQDTMKREWNPEPGAVAYLRQSEPLGLGHAIWCARKLIGDQPFAVLLADDLILSDPPCLAQMVEAYRPELGSLLAVESLPREAIHAYGVVDPEPLSSARGPSQRGASTWPLRSIVEKPDPDAAPSNFAVVGRYILHTEVLDHLEEQIAAHRGPGEIPVTEAIARMIPEPGVQAFCFTGERFDCGSKEGFVAANVAYGLLRPELRASLLIRLRSLLGGDESSCDIPRRYPASVP